MPDESIICTWTINLALATDAVNRGATLLLDHRVESVDVGRRASPAAHRPRDRSTARWVVNAAGLGADLIDGMFGHDRFTVTPRRGELLVFDKLARPTGRQDRAAGAHVAGQGRAGQPDHLRQRHARPDRRGHDRPHRHGTPREDGFDFLLDKGRALMPELLDEEVTATYAGLRAAIDHADYLIEADPAQRYLLVGGIRSTGLTSGMAIAEYVVGLLARPGSSRRRGPSCPIRPGCPTSARPSPRPYQDDDAIAADPAYGRIVCFCERVTEGEIRDACRSVIPPADLDGLRRRTRVMNGRCQGFFCGAEVADALLRGARAMTAVRRRRDHRRRTRRADRRR